MVRRFELKCSREIFSERELGILRKWGHWFESLADGSLEPTTEAQKRFIKVARGQAEPISEYEIAWWKYIKRVELESDPAQRRAMRPASREIDRSFGGSRAWYSANAARRGGFFKPRKRK